MAVREDFIRMASNDVDMLSVLRFIESDLGVTFDIAEGNTIYLRCPSEVNDIESSVHSSSSTTKTSLNLKSNKIKCYNPACACNKPMDTIAVIGLFYGDLSFESRVKKVLEIGGFEYQGEEKELSRETQIAILRTRYVREKNEQLLLGYEMIEEKKDPRSGAEVLYIDAANYLLSRGISKDISRQMLFGVAGGTSDVIKKADTRLLKESKLYDTEKKYEILGKRILIPNIFKGLVQGITGRAIYEAKSRYLNVGDVKSLINIDKAKEHETIFLFEGGINGASYCELTGLQNFMTLQGASTFKANFLSEIVKNSAKFGRNTEFVYVADNDTAGLYAAKSLGMEILRLGFVLNVLVTPLNKKGSKIDVNDILVKYGKEKGKAVWDKFVTTAEPFIIFAIKEDISKIKSLNVITTEIKKIKIIQNYLNLDFVDPNERWVIEQYLTSHGYPATSDFFKYSDIHFSKKPKIMGSRLVCFVGEISNELTEILDENEKEYNLIDISAKTNMYDVDKSVDIVLITTPLYLFKTKKLSQKLDAEGHNVLVYYSEKPIASLLEYVFALTKAVPYKEFFVELLKK